MNTEVDSQRPMSERPSSGVPRWRRAFVKTSVTLAMLLAGTSLLPVVLIHTSLRDRVLRSGIGEDAQTVTSGTAVGGWLTPLIFYDVRIADSEGTFLCTIRELRTSQGLLGFLIGGDNIGKVTLVHPQVEVHVTQDGKWLEGKDSSSETKADDSKTQLSYLIEDASLIVTVPWRKMPILDLDQVDITGKIDLDAEGRRMLTVDATQIADRETLSEAHTEQNLALIAPVLSQSTELSGSVSVWLDEAQMLLDEIGKTPFPLTGRVEFHSLEARLKPAWVRQLANATGQLTGVDLANRMEVLKDSRVEFAVTDDGVFHEGIVFLLPEIAKELTITSSGIIHLDETLDMRLEVNLPKIVAADKPLLSILGQLTSEPLQLEVRGTVSKPQLQLPEGKDLLGTIAGRVTPAGNSETATPIPSAILDVVQDASNPEKDQKVQALTGSILNLIRSIDKKAKEDALQNPKKKRRK